MKETFKREWLKKIPTYGNFDVPTEYDLENFSNWQKEFEIDDKNLICNGRGWHSKIYDVGQGLAAKVFRNTPLIKGGMTISGDIRSTAKIPYFLEREFWMAKELEKLKEKGFRIAEPEGLFLVYEKHLNQFKPAFVMKKIDNVYYENYPMKEVKKIREVTSEKLDIARDNGIITGVDSDWTKNCLLSEDGEIYFIDFMYWGIRD